jgi:hypothetical protein
MTMTPFEPNLSSLAVARDVLLTPFGLDEGKLITTLGTMFTHKVDYADLYFQFTKSEGWSLEEGIVKSGSFSIDQGVGVRAVSGDKTAFAYSDDISQAALLDAAAATRTIARAGAGRIKVASQVQPSGGRSLYLPNDPLASLDATAKVALLERIEKIARAKDPRVVQVMAGLAGEYDVVLVVRSDGVLAADIRPLVRVSVTVIAEQDGRREMGSSGGGGRYDYGYFSEAARQICQRSRAGGAGQPGSASGPGRSDDHRARTGLARRAAARSGRPRPGRRLQPQGFVGLRRHDRPARRRQGRHRGRRRHPAGPPRFAQHGRRGQRRPSARP